MEEKFSKSVSCTNGVSAGKKDQIEFFFKKKFLSKIDVDLIIWSRIFVISKKIFLSIWFLFPALTPYVLQQLHRHWRETLKILYDRVKAKDDKKKKGNKFK